MLTFPEDIEETSTKIGDLVLTFKIRLLVILGEFLLLECHYNCLFKVSILQWAVRSTECGY